jgi:hypothetical protein
VRRGKVASAALKDVRPVFAADPAFFFGTVERQKEEKKE